MQCKKNLINQLLVASCFISSLAFAQNIPTAKPEDVGLSSARLKNIKASLQTEVDKGNIPGAVVMINRKGKLVYSEVVGYQDKATNKLMSKDSIFRIYSMTKPLASVAAMILVEDGKMQLADPISKFMPEFANMQVSVTTKDGNGNIDYSLVPANKPITV